MTDNWVLNNNCDINVLAAKAVSAKSGIGLEVYQTSRVSSSMPETQ
ncbi:MAG: hypothetical protein ACLR6J_20540 [Parabacteroides merdae]